MGARTLYHEIRHFIPEVVKIYARCVGAAAADPTGLQTTGHGSAGVASIAYNAATGKLLVTLDNKWADLLHCTGQVIDTTTPDDWEVTVDAETISSTKTISLSIWKGGALANLTTDEQLLLEITVANSSRKR